MRLIIYGLLALSPLPLASARPTWQWLWVLAIGLLSVMYCFRAEKNKTSDWPQSIITPSIMVAIFIAWGFIQAKVSTDLHTSILGLHTEFISVNPEATISNSLFFLAHLIFFLCIFAFCRNRMKAVNLIKFVSITVCAYATYGFIVYAAGNEYILWYDKWAYPSSLTSTFVNRNSFAAYTGLGLQCLVAYLFYWGNSELTEGRSGRELIRHVLETVLTKAWWLPLALFVMLTVLLLTQSRAGFASTFIGTLILIGLSANHYHTTKKNLLKRAAMFVSFVFISMLVFQISGDALEYRLALDASLDGRFLTYPYIINAIMENPITGYGLGTFDEVFRVYRGEDIKIYYDRAHNDYLELALTAGIPAASILLLACMLPVITLMTALKHGSQYRSLIALGISVTVQLGLHSLVDFSLQIPAVSYSWVAIIATSLFIAVKCKQVSMENID